MKKKAAATPATEALILAGISHVLHPYDMGALPEDAETYGEGVAALLDVEPERLFKTLMAEVDGEPVVAIVPASTRLSVKSLARAAGAKKAAMMAPSDAERLTGYVTGGISPFGQRRDLVTYVDETIELFDTVLVSAGRRGLQVEVAPSDLVALLGARVSDLT